MRDKVLGTIGNLELWRERTVGAEAEADRLRRVSEEEARATLNMIGASINNFILETYGVILEPGGIFPALPHNSKVYELARAIFSALESEYYDGRTAVVSEGG